MTSKNRGRLGEVKGEEVGPRVVYIPMNLGDTTTTTPYAVRVDFLSSSSSSSSSSSPPSSSAACSRQLCRPATPSEAGGSKDIHPQKKLVSAKPLSMKRSSSGKALNAATAFSGAVAVEGKKEETVVHADVADFRRIVHQLTGAATATCGNGGSGGRVAVARGSKLHERRKAGMRHLSSLAVLPNEPPIPAYSPVTPLASDFEKFCLPPNTPPSSCQSSGAPSPATTIQCLNYKPTTATSFTPEQHQHHQQQRAPYPTLLQLFPPSPSAPPQPM